MYLEKSHVTKVCNSINRRVEKLYESPDCGKFPFPGDALWLMLEGAYTCLFTIADNAEEVLDWFEHSPMSDDLFEKFEAYKEMI